MSARRDRLLRRARHLFDRWLAGDDASFDRWLLAHRVLERIP